MTARRVISKVGMVIGLFPAVLGLSDPAQSGGISNTLVISSLLCVGPWVLQNADLKIKKRK